MGDDEATTTRRSSSRGATCICGGLLVLPLAIVRPVTGETRRWGPVSQSGEYAFDVPHLFGTRRIGPDLTRVGLNTATKATSPILNPRISRRIP